MSSHTDHVRAYYDAVDEDRVEDLVALFTEDVAYDRPGQECIEGRDELREFYREDRPLSDGNHEVHDVIPDGDRVAVRGSFTGVQDGEPVEIGFVDVHVFDGDRIAERYTYTDRDTV